MQKTKRDPEILRQEVVVFQAFQALQASKVDRAVIHVWRTTGLRRERAHRDPRGRPKDILRLEVVDFQAAKALLQKSFLDFALWQPFAGAACPRQCFSRFVLPGSVCVLTVREVLNEGCC